MQNKIPLPPGIQKQVTLFLTDYPPREAQEIVKRYLGLVLSEKYRSASATKLDGKTVIRSLPKPRVRVKNINEPKARKKNAKSTSKSSRTKQAN
jgi:hypothetical protein